MVSNGMDHPEFSALRKTPCEDGRSQRPAASSMPRVWVRRKLINARVSRFGVISIGLDEPQAALLSCLRYLKSHNSSRL